MGYKRGPEIDDGTRAAVVALNKKARLPFSDITNLVGALPSTAKDIVKHAVINTRNSLPKETLTLANEELEQQIITLACKKENVHPNPRPGQPKTLNPR
jgi:hypothetical protein